jgi:crossover junction endodeoxyribonuclease RuvC
VISVGGGRLQLLDAGVIRAPRTSPLESRLLELHEGIASVLAAFRPLRMGLEEIYSHYAHPATAIIMAHARGVLCLAAAESGVAVTALPATLIKRLVTGNGRAGKQQVGGMVAHLLGLKNIPGPADVSDALAAAIAVAESEK